MSHNNLVFWIVSMQWSWILSKFRCFTWNQHSSITLATFQLVANIKRPGYDHLIVNQEDESEANVNDFVDIIIFGSKFSVSHFL